MPHWDVKQSQNPREWMSNQAQSDMNAFANGIAGFPGFNTDGLNQLIEDTSPEAALKVIARFRLTVEGGLADIEGGVKAGNAEIVWKTAHKVAGTAELIGFDDFGQASKVFSHIVRENPDLAKHGEGVADYVSTCRRLADKLHSFGWLSRYA